MLSIGVYVFNVLSIGAIILLGITLLTALISSSVSRSPVWYTYMISIFVLSATNIMIVGQQCGPQAPSRVACIGQAILIYPTVVFPTYAACALLLQIYLTVVYYGTSRGLPKAIAKSLFVVPVVMTAIALGISTISAALDPSRAVLDASGMRCHIDHKNPTTFISTVVICSFAATPILILEPLLIRKVLHGRRTLKNQDTAGYVTHSSGSMDMALRVCCFNILFLFALVALSMTFKLGDGGQGTINMAMAILPMGGGMLFGLQKDIIGVWKSWTQRVVSRHPRPSPLEI
ncbi:hypothetical protein CPC08DRAFT_323348 [Agrocybe pediades]|nr:hypothetical protein CPC08DRAFT_323348 [Agrocybe pediades]